MTGSPGAQTDAVGLHLMVGPLEVFLSANDHSRKRLYIVYWDLNLYSRWADIDVLKCMLGKIIPSLLRKEVSNSILLRSWSVIWLFQLWLALAMSHIICLEGPPLDLDTVCTDADLTWCLMLSLWISVGLPLLSAISLWQCPLVFRLHFQPFVKTP